MKSGNPPHITGYEVVLPQEIIVAILSCVRSFSQENHRRKAFWSCCHLSKLWYSCAIQYLYHAPKLSNRNFEKFARTICPPVNAHVRHVGLESFVCHLNMGHLAYESTKSLTARLLRRTRLSLETFVAPAVSFSLAGLVPLSKCRNLHLIDLSKDSYDIDLAQVLNAVGGLPYLTTLSLPRAAMKTRCNFGATASGKAIWPPRLAYLQVNDILPQQTDHWQELVSSWPPSLKRLALEDCSSWDPLFGLHQADKKALYVESLMIGMRHEEDAFPIEFLLISFPNLRSLIIPTPTGSLERATAVSDLGSKREILKHLSFRQVPDSVLPKPKLTTRFLFECVQIHSMLIKIEVPEPYLHIDDGSADDLDNMEKLMTLRAGASDDDIGVFLTEG